MQDAYAKHLENVRQELPPHSGLPPTLDLSKSVLADSSRDSAWYIWKARLFSAGSLTDPGARAPSEATSIATTFLDGGLVYDLPARSADAVIVAKPVGTEVRIDPSRSLVYSRFSLQISRVLKGKAKRDIREGATITGVEYGGSIRFPSGHVETFILANRGFLELDKHYLIFMWKTNRSVNTYFVGEAYLISDNLVFSINTVPDESAYNGMPLEKFETKVRAAIAKNIDSD